MSLLYKFFTSNFVYSPELNWYREVPGLSPGNWCGCHTICNITMVVIVMCKTTTPVTWIQKSEIVFQISIVHTRRPKHNFFKFFWKAQSVGSGTQVQELPELDSHRFLHFLSLLFRISTLYLSLAWPQRLILNIKILLLYYIQQIQLRVTFFYNPRFKLPLRGHNLESIKGIKENSQVALKGILENEYQKCFEDWNKRWHKCGRELF